LRARRCLDEQERHALHLLRVEDDVDRVAAGARYLQAVQEREREASRGLTRQMTEAAR
jgi:hypothetical protein